MSHIHLIARCTACKPDIVLRLFCLSVSLSVNICSCDLNHRCGDRNDFESVTWAKDYVMCNVMCDVCNSAIKETLWLAWYFSALKTIAVPGCRAWKARRPSLAPKAQSPLVSIYCGSVLQQIHDKSNKWGFSFTPLSLHASSTLILRSTIHALSCSVF